MHAEKKAGMASLWQRIQFLYLGRKSVARIVLPLAVLTIIVLVLRWASTPAHITVGDVDESFR